MLLMLLIDHALEMINMPSRSQYSLKDMAEDGVRPNEKFYMALIRATGAGARADKTVEILQQMGESGITPGVRSYNCAIGACGKVLYVIELLSPDSLK